MQPYNQAGSSLPYYKVSAKQTVVRLDFHELWSYREMLYFLIWRDIKVRYKQTLIGAAWALLQPFITMIVFTIFFGGLAQVTSNGIPYPIFSFAALVPWGFFSNAIGLAADSLVANGQLVRKLYFPRILLPAGRILSGVLDFVLAFGLLLALMVYYRQIPLVDSIIVLPIILILLLAITFAIGLWLAAINTRYRDIRYILPFLLQIWMFVSPVIYSTSRVPEALRPLYAINPIVSVIEGFRGCLLGSSPLTPLMLIVSYLVAIILLVSGTMYFQRSDGKFADII